jgi:quinol monooxygenase YgiN
MYGMCGKLVAQAGKRGDFVEILARAASLVGQLPGCRLYLINEDLADSTSIWVYEVWDDKESHDASLKDDRVRSLIMEAMPLMGGSPESVELRVVGGHGVPEFTPPFGSP